MKYEPGQVFSAEWDGDGSWRVLEVLAVDGERLEVLLHAERFAELPDLGVLGRLHDDPGERQTIDQDAFALMWPAELEPVPEEQRSTRRGLLGDLLRSGVERGEDLARRRRPPWA
jgi:hypothetical protein